MGRPLGIRGRSTCSISWRWTRHAGGAPHCGACAGGHHYRTSTVNSTHKAGLRTVRAAAFLGGGRELHTREHTPSRAASTTDVVFCFSICPPPARQGRWRCVACRLSALLPLLCNNATAAARNRLLLTATKRHPHARAPNKRALTLDGTIGGAVLDTAAGRHRRARTRRARRRRTGRRQVSIRTPAAWR